MSEKSPEEIRSEVSSAYGAAIARKSASGGCCSGPQKDSGKAACGLGYGESDLASLPESVAETTFGCGNPLAFSQVRLGQTVVDLGSGAGLDLLIAAKQVGPTGRAIGIDMTDEMIERARENIRKAGAVNAEVRRGIIENLPLDNQSTDWVISNCVINLSPEKDKVFSEIARVLRPGGRFSISDIVAEDLPVFFRDNAALRNACVSGAISEKEYVAGLEKAGLTDVRVTERVVYDASQIRGFVGSSSLPPELLALGEEKIMALASQVAGKVWSARFEGKKA